MKLKFLMQNSGVFPTESIKPDRKFTQGLEARGESDLRPG